MLTRLKTTGHPFIAGRSGIAILENNSAVSLKLNRQLQYKAITELLNIILEKGKLTLKNENHPDILNRQIVKQKTVDPHHGILICNKKKEL